MFTYIANNYGMSRSNTMTVPIGRCVCLLCWSIPSECSQVIFIQPSVSWLIPHISYERIIMTLPISQQKAQSLKFSLIVCSGSCTHTSLRVFTCDLYPTSFSHHVHLQSGCKVTCRVSEQMFPARPVLISKSMVLLSVVAVLLLLLLWLLLLLLLLKYGNVLNTCTM